jgi:cellobiose phosphorylase
MKDTLWKFIDDEGSFCSSRAHTIGSLYFPLANEALLSSISPDLHGDSKASQNSFLLQPVSRIDLVNLRSSRNFWVYSDKRHIWSATGVSCDRQQREKDKVILEAGFLWHKVARENRRMGLKAEVLSFVPSSGEPVEVMQVKLSNISSRVIQCIPTAAIPLYARSADTIRDHRHVTSLLTRIKMHRSGVIVQPTLLFDESGHRPNKNIYFVFGWDAAGRGPQYIYPTQEMFCGDGGSLEHPESVFENLLPSGEDIQGKEPMGALRFRSVRLKAGASKTYTVVMGITKNKSEINRAIRLFSSPRNVDNLLQMTRQSWVTRSRNINISTGDKEYDNWFRWVSIQPVLRKIYGCSFLPDFDYGKGGRGWRDLWQDCLGLILSDPQQVREILINNFSGIRMDGSNATIIGKKPGEFIADRNNISRVWMDHGVWPLITLDLYLQETGDINILWEDASYFRDHQLSRSQEFDRQWNPGAGYQLRTKTGKIYKGSIAEHLLVENLVQFYNVGRHNCVRLEGADWNDGLDMARKNGESVAFSCMYAHNLKRLAELLSVSGFKEFSLVKELRILLRSVAYSDVGAKKECLEDYFKAIRSGVSGEKITVDRETLVEDLSAKAKGMGDFLRVSEWLREGFFNGYYDEKSRRVDGIRNNKVHMQLASQVFPIMSAVATEGQMKSLLRKVDDHLFDRRLRGFRLNTDFGREQHDLGRAFSFVYGEKENGAVFNHMVVMFAYALYKRGFVPEGWRALRSISDMALDTEVSKVYPCLPEYFNGQGRGMYSYLTGSASWFVLTMLTQVFGVKGEKGDLLIEPKLTASQFARSGCLSMTRVFAGRKIRVDFYNPKKLPWGVYTIRRVMMNAQEVPFSRGNAVRIARGAILKLPRQQLNTISVFLGS